MIMHSSKVIMQFDSLLHICRFNAVDLQEHVRGTETKFLDETYWLVANNKN